MYWSSNRQQQDGGEKNVEGSVSSLFKVLSQHFVVELGKSMKTLDQNSWFLHKLSNPGPLENKEESVIKMSISRQKVV
jgi:hypothetical protein